MLKQATQSEDCNKAYAEVERFCLFIGYPRSGGSLLGALLDAHPNMVVSHELDALKILAEEPGIGRAGLFDRIQANARHEAERRRPQSGYFYAVEGACQGHSDSIRVIGDKQCKHTSEHLLHRPELLPHLEQTAEVPILFVHPVRNPFDIVTTTVLRSRLLSWKFWRRGFTIEEATRLLLEVWTAGVLKTRATVPEDRWLTVHHEDTVKNPQAALQRLCSFLGQDCPEDYCRACMRLIWQKPHQSRHDLQWTEDQRRRLREGIRHVDFLRRYLDEA